tara:strand:- start:135 stop:1238 length:1104 start_codon:yes stop_codon:yes gene_type:complete
LPSFSDLFEAGRFVLIFAGLIPTMNLVKSAALNVNSIKETQKLLSLLSSKNSSSGFQITGHLSGSIMNTGVFPMLAASMPSDSNLNYRKKVAEASIRGMASSVVWSPFFVAFAVGQVYIDNFNSWMGLAVGLFIGSLFSIVSVFLLNRSLNYNLFKASLNCLRPIFIYLFVIMSIIVVFALVFNLTALSAVILIMPILIVLYFLRTPIELKFIFTNTISSMRKNIDDIVIISLAMMIGFLITNAENNNLSFEIFNIQNIPDFLIFIIIPLTMCFFSIICIHPVISSTILLTIFSSNIFDINHALLMQAHLIGWCTGTLSSVASLTVITCSNLFNVPSLKIAFGENLFVVILFSIFGGGILGILNIII